MTDRIYTIPARAVVAGMLIDGMVIHAVEITEDGTVQAKHRGPVWDEIFEADSHAMVPVSLPSNGPSPRELLCSCNEYQLGQGADEHRLPVTMPIEQWSTLLPPERHADDCSVRRLRLRLWPVGAEWESDGEDADLDAWLVPSTSGSPYCVRVEDVATDFAMWPEPDAGIVRAAFCEPEGQP